jgi:hypothetical protein
MVSRERPLITVVTATGLEYAQARKALPDSIAVIRAGISLRTSRERVNGIAISCGLAGGLRDDLPTGTVLVPHTIALEDGTEVPCDAQLVQKLSDTARTLGRRVQNEPLLTSRALVHGPRRAQWAARGFAGVDMESGFIAAERLACVRVVLDTPHREIAPAWLDGKRAAVTPRAWIDLPFLIKNGPRSAWAAAEVIAAAFG